MSRVRSAIAPTRSWLRSRSGRQRAGAAAGVVLLATAPFGGLEEASDAALPTVETGKSFRVGPYEVTIDRVVSVADLSPAATPEVEGNRLLGVVAEVANVTDRPEAAYLLREGVRISGAGVVDDGELPQLLVVSDGTSPSWINPELSGEMVILVEHRPTADQTVRIDVVGQSFVEESALTLGEDFTWRSDDEVVARGELDVRVVE